MSRAKTSESAPDEADARADKQERRSHWRRVRRRFLGAVAVFLLIGMLWQLGDDSRPPSVSPAEPSAEPFAQLAENPALQNAAAELDSAEDFTPATQESFYEDSAAADSQETDDAQTPVSESSLPEESSADESENEITVAESSSPESSPSEESFADESENTITAAETVAESSSPENSPPEKTEPAVVADSAAEEDDSVFFEIDKLSGFSVQAGAFAERKRALRLARKLRGAGFSVKILPLRLEDALLFRVRAVGYPARADAELARREIVKLGYPAAAVRDFR